MIGITIDNRHPGESRPADGFKIQGLAHIDHKHIGPGRHNLRRIGIIELKDIINQISFFFFDFTLFLDDIDKGHQLFFGGYRGALDLSR